MQKKGLISQPLFVASIRRKKMNLVIAAAQQDQDPEDIVAASIVSTASASITASTEASGSTEAVAVSAQTE